MEQLLVDEQRLPGAGEADQHGGELKLDEDVQEELHPDCLRVVDQTGLGMEMLPNM